MLTPVMTRMSRCNVVYGALRYSCFTEISYSDQAVVGDRAELLHRRDKQVVLHICITRQQSSQIYSNLAMSLRLQNRPQVCLMRFAARSAVA